MHEFKGAIKDETCMILSILFHDVVYDPRSNRNEEDSACLFDAFAENVELLLFPFCPYFGTHDANSFRISPNPSIGAACPRVTTKSMPVHPRHQATRRE